MSPTLQAIIFSLLFVAILAGIIYFRFLRQKSRRKNDVETASPVVPVIATSSLAQNPSIATKDNGDAFSPSKTVSDYAQNTTSATVISTNERQN